jgi:hypothetical protein
MHHSGVDDWAMVIGVAYSNPKAASELRFLLHEWFLILVCADPSLSSHPPRRPLG